MDPVSIVSGLVRDHGHVVRDHKHELFALVQAKRRRICLLSSRSVLSTGFGTFGFVSGAVPRTTLIGLPFMKPRISCGTPFTMYRSPSAVLPVTTRPGTDSERCCGRR